MAPPFSRGLASVFLLLLLIGCANQTQRGSPVTQLDSSARGLLSEAEEAIIEALVRDDAKHVPDDTRDFKFKEIFLSINGKDPSEKLLAKLRDLSKPVLPKSEARGGNGVFNKRTGARGVSLGYRDVQIKNGNTASVYATFYVGPLSATGEECELKLENGKWIIVQRKQKWIS